MAMFSTFVAWGLIQAGLPLGAALALTLVLSFLGGMVIERVIIRPVEGGEPLVLVIVTLGLLILLNSGAGWIWGFGNRSFPSLFGNDSIEVAGVRIDVESLGIVAVMLAVVGLVFLFTQRTKLGLAMRAVAMNPESSRLSGIAVGRTLMVGWGLAAAVGALAGALIAPRLFLDVNFMGGVLIYAFAAATARWLRQPARSGRRRLDHRCRRDAGGQLRRLHRLGPEDPRAAGDHPGRPAHPPSGLFGSREVARA
jgi:branched-chain amino acid transport system permease protein